LGLTAIDSFLKMNERSFLFYPDLDFCQGKVKLTFL
jgi:hypothetical protein